MPSVATSWTPRKQKYRQAYAITRLVGQSEPRLFITVGSAMDQLNADYDALSRVAGLQVKEAESTSDEAMVKHWKGEQEAWQGEAGVLAIGQGELQGALPQYFEKIKATPPASTEELFKLESEAVDAGLSGDRVGAEEGEAGGGCKSKVRRQTAKTTATGRERRLAA